MQPCLQAVACLSFAKTKESSSAEQRLHMMEIRKPAVIVSHQWGVVQHRDLRDECLDPIMCSIGEKLVRAC